MALISVLWSTGLLAVLAAGFAYTSRTQARLSLNQLENAKAEALADGGVQLAVLRLRDLDPETAWRANRSIYTFEMGDGDVSVLIEDEDSKIDLNGAPLELIAGLYQAIGLAEDEAQAMAARIVDFRDEDHDPEPSGAEEPAYLKAGLHDGPNNRPFTAESELLRVLGMTPILYEQVRAYVTVHSGAEGIDPTRASRPVLEALPGITPPLVEALLTAGPGVDPLSAIEDQLLLADIENYILPSRELVFTIHALGRTSGGGRFLRQAVIELGASRGRPFLVYAWSRGTLLDTESLSVTHPAEFVLDPKSRHRRFSSHMTPSGRIQ